MLKPTKQKEIKRKWHLFDAKDKVLGRVSTEIAKKLMGKFKPYFVRHLDCGDYVVVVNAAYVKVTGKKRKQKQYLRFSGYPGGLKRETFENLQQRFPEKIIKEAVKNMLPNNKLRDRMMARLYIYKGDEHPYKDKFEVRNPKSETNPNFQKL